MCIFFEINVGQIINKNKNRNSLRAPPVFLTRLLFPRPSVACTSSGRWSSWAAARIRRPARRTGGRRDQLPRTRPCRCPSSASWPSGTRTTRSGCSARPRSVCRALCKKVRFATRSRRRQRPSWSSSTAIQKIDVVSPGVPWERRNYVPFTWCRRGGGQCPVELSWRFPPAQSVLNVAF